jgi:hypothetical protein
LDREKASQTGMLEERVGAGGRWEKKKKKKKKCGKV